MHRSRMPLARISRRLPALAALALTLPLAPGVAPPAPAAAPAPAASSFAAQRAQLARARARWSAQHVDTYRLRLTIRCDCPPASDRPVEITVVGGRPQHARYFPGQLQTFPQMFHLIAQILADPNSEGGSARYDQHRGFPRAARFDAIAWTVDHFRVLSAHE